MSDFFHENVLTGTSCTSGVGCLVAPSNHKTGSFLGMDPDSLDF